VKIGLFNAVYRVAKPFVGNRGAVWLAGMAPAVLFVGVPLLLFWLFIAGLPTTGSDTHQTCGSGAYTWDC
jgi:hypothetical protein